MSKEVKVMLSKEAFASEKKFFEEYISPELLEILKKDLGGSGEIKRIDYEKYLSIISNDGEAVAIIGMPVKFYARVNEIN